MKRIAIITLLVILSGCYNAPDPLKPGAFVMKQMPDDAPNNYKLGWKDGCESGLSSMTSTTYKTFYSFKQDKTRRMDPTYYKSWKDAYTFCRHYVYGTIRQANIRMRLPNARPQFLETFLGTENIFDHGLLQLQGPADQGQLFSKIGTIGGNGNTEIGLGDVLDFSNEAPMNGKGENPIWNWDYRLYSK